jgi:hypothetical protein
MPTVSIQFGPEHVIGAEDFSALSRSLADVIEQRLAARRDTIQVLPSQLAYTPFGSPVYVEIKARDNAHRTDEVIADFLAEVDEITYGAFATRCRIRYFKYPGTFLGAVN